MVNSSEKGKEHLDELAAHLKSIKWDKKEKIQFLMPFIVGCKLNYI